LEANQTVNQIFKLNREDQIQKNVIKEFLVEGKKTYHPILKAISKNTGNIDESLSEFKDAILPIFNFLKSQKVRKTKEKEGFWIPTRNPS
jgi:hypothetical protein